MNRLADILKQEMDYMGYDLQDFPDEVWEDVARIMLRILNEEDDIRKKVSSVALCRKSLQKQLQSLEVELSDLQNQCPHFQLDPHNVVDETVLSYKCRICEGEINDV